MPRRIVTSVFVPTEVSSFVRRTTLVTAVKNDECLDRLSDNVGVGIEPNDPTVKVEARQMADPWGYEYQH